MEGPVPTARIDTTAPIRLVGKIEKILGAGSKTSRYSHESGQSATLRRHDVEVSGKNRKARNKAADIGEPRDSQHESHPTG